MTTYYNGKCPVCAAGVADQRRRAARAGAACAWVDINDEPEALAAHGIALDDVRLRLQAIDGEGRLRVGVEAFAAIWGELPRWRRLARLIGLPGLRSGAHWLYDRLAYRLYAWNQRRGRW